MKNRRKLIMTLIFAVAAVASALLCFACADKPEYSRKHEFDQINANAVIHIEKNSLTFAKGMTIDTESIIESCDCMLIDPDSGKQLEITAADLKNGMVSYERFDLNNVGRKKSIKLKFKKAENYILYDVIDFNVNLYIDKDAAEPWRSARASASLDPDDLGLSVWVDTATYNYATDETARATDAERAKRFNGWYDVDEVAVTGRYGVTVPTVGTERVVNLYADFLTAEQLEGYKLDYDTRGRLVFNGYDGDATTVVVPESVTYINMQEVFAENPVGFKTLQIPSNAVVDVPFTAGLDTTGLEEIIVDSGSPRYSSYNGALYSKNREKLYFMPSSNKNTDFHEALKEFDTYSCAYWEMETLALPESVTTLGSYCFAHSLLTSVSGLERVSLGRGWNFDTKINPYEDGTALYAIITPEGAETPKYSLSMILDKTVTEYTVIPGTESIAGSAFYNCDKLEKINLGNDLKSIGASAFSGCTALETVALPSTLTEMGEGVFYGCTALTAVTGLSDVTYVDGGKSYEHTVPSRLFYGCENLTGVVLPDGVETIGSYVFYNNKALTSIDIPSTVDDILQSAFEGSGLTSITFPAGLKSIGRYAFRNCSALSSSNLGDCAELESIGGSGFYGTGLTSVTIPEKITTIPDHCFYSTKLKSIDISGVVTLEDYAISRNTGLTTITFGDKLRTIGTRALSSNTKITNVVLPESVETIGGYAFAACTGLKTITIGSKVVNIGVYEFESDGVSFASGAATSPVFFQCSKLEEINVSDSNERFVSVDGVLYGKEVGGQEYADKTAVLYAVPSNYQTAKLTLPETVKVILPYAAHYIRTKGATTEIELNEGLLNIGKAAFYNSTNITSLTIPSTVTNIGASILLGDDKMQNFEIAEGNTKYNTDGNLVYEGNNVSMYLGLLDTVEIQSGKTQINMGVFMNNTTITSIVIPDSIVTIGEKAFSGCANLTSIHIGASVRNIDPSAFALLSGLETITVSENNQYFKAVDNVLYSKDGKKVVLAAANNGMTGLDELESGVTDIGDYAFSYHKTLESVVLPATVKSIGAYSFYECREVAYFYASEALETMGERAFSFATTINPDDSKETRCCDKLIRVLLYGNLKGVADDAFYGQYGIQYVYFKMTYTEAKAVISGSGKNYVYLTRGCSNANGGERFNEVICCLYTDTEPTVDYDGYTWFIFDENGVPRPYNIER